MTHYYHRTVLIIYHLRDQVDVLFGLGHGISWGLEALKASPTANGNQAVENPASTQAITVKPSGTDKDIAEAILGALPSSANPEKLEAATALLEWAVKWNMVKLWKNTLDKCGSGMFKMHGPDASAEGDGQDIWTKRVSEGLVTFGFDSLASRYECLVQLCSRCHESDCFRVWKLT